MLPFSRQWPFSSLGSAVREGMEPSGCELLVSRTSPHLVVAAAPAWLRATGFTEGDVLRQPMSILQGENTCQATLGALWSAIQVRRKITLSPLPPPTHRTSQAPPRAGATHILMQLSSTLTYGPCMPTTLL